MLLQRIVALLIAIVTFFANCFGITSLNMVPYAELRTELDDSIPLLTGDHSEGFSQISTVASAWRSTSL